MKLSKYKRIFEFFFKTWISSVSFQHKDIHKQTWKIPGGRGANQIDHALVDRRHASSVMDVRSCHGANCDSDHFLVRLRLRQRLSTLSKDNKYRRTKWNIEKLRQSEDTQTRYQALLVAKLQQGDQEEENMTLNSHWNRIQAAIRDAAMETIEKRRNRKEEE